MRCKSCEREVKSDFKYCPYCAARLIHDFGDHYEALEPDYVLPPEANQEDPAAVLYGQPQETEASSAAIEFHTPSLPFEPENLHQSNPSADLPSEEKKQGEVHFSTTYLQEDDLYFEDLPEDAFSTRQSEELLFKEMRGYQVFQPKTPVFQQDNSFSADPLLAAAKDMIQENLYSQKSPSRMAASPEPLEQSTAVPLQQQQPYLPRQEDFSEELSPDSEDFILPDEVFDQPEPKSWEETPATQQHSETFKAHLPRQLEDEETSAFLRHTDQAPYAGSPRARGYASGRQPPQDGWAEDAPYVPLEPDRIVAAASERPDQLNAGDIFIKSLLILFLLSAGAVISILIYYFCNTPNPFQSFSFSTLLAAWLR